jgi:hypothetical protein
MRGFREPFEVRDLPKFREKNQVRGQRFKSSLPDQSFQALKSYFWFFRHTAVDDFVDGSVFLFFQLKFNSIDSRTIECESAKNYNQNAR